MLTGIRFPHKISAEELDRYMENGWRPMGQGIYTTNFLRPEDGKIYGTLSSRLPIQQFTFRKSQRKLLQKNREKFTVKKRTALLTQEMLKVADAYQQKFPDKGGSDLEFHLENHRGEKVFNTWEIAVYKGSRLIAFSFFDIGIHSLYSKIGLYDPEFSEDSLGIYTMLEEIQYGLDHNMAYYYPGYVALGLPTFDYKHRIGALEYYELQSGKWLPYATLDPCKTPIYQIKSALEALNEAIKQEALLSALMTYPQFDVKLSLPESLPYLDNPFILLTDSHSQAGFTPHVTTFNPIEGTYEVQQILLVGGRLLPEMIKEANDWDDLLLTLVCTRPFFQSTDLKETATFLVNR